MWSWGEGFDRKTKSESERNPNKLNLSINLCKRWVGFGSVLRVAKRERDREVEMERNEMRDLVFG